MLFQVSMTVRIPHDMDPKKVGELSALEHQRAADLQREGKWLHLWRVVGSYANLSIFKVETPDELHAILESLPLRPFMETQVSALCRHPGALADAE
jgi:muconolactone D-isomerase